MKTMTMRLPAPYILCCILISIGGLLFGLDTGCIGPITTMPTFLDSFGPLSSTIHGILVSSILIPASLTSFFAGNVADHLGRINTCSIGGLVFAAGTALEAGAQNLAMLFVGRCITGVGEGLFLSTLVVYVCEIAPARQRGVLASVQQLLVTMGIAVGYFTCYGTVRSSTSSFSWRFPFALQSFLAFIYALLAFLFFAE
jgi:MFS family permease